MSSRRPPSAETPTPSNPNPRPPRTRRTEQCRNPFTKPKGITYATITLCLLALFGVTLAQAACASGTAAPSSVPSAAASPPGAAPSASASAAANPSPSVQRNYSAPPPMTIDKTKKYTATIKTERGDIVMQLDPSLAPLTVNNFVFLAEHHFYDGLTWHRVVPGFVIQGGDPTGTGGGGPGYKFQDELPSSASVYKEGCVAMANSGPNTNGSQFFICSADDTKQLKPLYSLFGYVTQGMDVVKQIQVGDHMLSVTIS